ncbi:HNH endonuclease [Bartonella tamiae]|uniref:HNH nuclease domain-containing protein n=1 Tax=Bartonella tamiae Th239 TaxID=1094558 RepID=J0QZP7_9HYPH|nr:HNH endonuclease signature motif containing protein [Bartonella tamiae]EJF91641.1 hypothetical protein ME5_00020 [Bartonella tamiae Th239]EJF92684.1 hypothetical protein MEG_01854 [Bartonella tamiae Th307]
MVRKEFSRKLKNAIRDRANGKCEKCKAVLKQGEGEVDHILPAAYGGEPTMANGQFLCHVCHNEKTKKDVLSIRKADRAKDKATGTLTSKTPMPKRPKEPKRLTKTLPPRRGGIAAQYVRGE